MWRYNKGHGSLMGLIFGNAADENIQLARLIEISIPIPIIMIIESNRSSIIRVIEITINRTIRFHNRMNNRREKMFVLV